MSIFDQYRDQSLENAGLRAQLAQVKATSGAEIKRLRRSLVERAELAERNHMAFKRAARNDALKACWAVGAIALSFGVAIGVLIPA